MMTMSPNQIFIYIYKEDCLSELFVYMHLHSFQDTEIKLCRWVKDYPGQVIQGMTILGVPPGMGGWAYI